MNTLKKFTKHAGWSLSLLLLLFSMQVKAQLSGSYTIDGSTAASSTNFKSFTAAADSLASVGVSGAVTFSVASGTYSGSLTFGAISGASSTNTISFMSAAGDSSKVTLTSSNSTGTVIFNGAKYITFHGIMIQNTGASSSSAVYFEDGAEYDSLSHCIVRATYQYSEIVQLYGLSGANNRNVISECAIHGGEMGVYSFNYSTPYQTGNIISGNIIDSFVYYGVYSYYDDSIVITKNTIENPISGGNDYYGVYMIVPQTAYFITKNKIILPGTASYGTYGIYFDYGAYLSSNDTSLIANNFISIIGGTSNSYGVYAYYFYYTNFVYNNISITNTNTSSTGITDYDYGGSGMLFENNIAANFGGGDAIYVYSSSSAGTLNYNDWYVPSTSSYLGYWGGSQEATLSDWQTASSQDANSFAVDPIFVSNIDLTPNADSLYKHGTPIADVSDDINGKARNTTTPDIGAVEFKPTATDAGVVSVDSPGIGFCAGKYPVYVTFKDFGVDTLTSVTVYWTVNGTAQTAYNWTGSLAQGQTQQILLGNITFSTNTVYNIKAYTGVPNGTTDQNHKNDTTDRAVSSGLSGSYTIGGTSPDFASFSSAVSAINTRGLCSKTIFNVRNGTYNESISFGAIPGVSSANTITFQSASGDSSTVMLENASTVVSFSNASYINFKKITVINTGSSPVFDITNKSSYDSISHCVIRSSYQYGEDIYIYGYGYPTGNSNSYLTINDNAIHGGGYAVYSFGSYYSPFQSDNVITGNIIDSFYYDGIESFYDDSIVISNNLIRNPSSSTTDGVYMIEPESNGFFIFNNKMIFPSGAGSAIYFDYGGLLTGTDTSKIYNNFIAILGGTTNSYGFYAYYPENTEFVYNNINITNTGSSSAGIYDQDYGGSGMVWENNISSNTGGGYSINISNATYAGTLNYNDWYVPSSSSYLGVWGGSTEATLSDWQTASSQDANSYSVDPIFASTTNLTPNSDSLYHRGTPIAGIPADINDTTRNASTPDIGAVEFIPTHNDAGVFSIDSPTAGFCPGKLPIYATIKDFGIDSLKSVTIDWTVNGVSQTAYSWTGKLGQGQTQQVKLGSLTFSAGTFYNIVIYTINPNGKPDANHKNDTSYARVANGMSGTYTIGGTSPDYATFGAAVSDVTSRGLCSSVIFNVRDGVYPEDISFPNGIPGSSSTKTVTFQSASGDSNTVFLRDNSTSTASSVVNINNATYLTFKGITIQNQGSASNVINITNSSYITFSHNHIIAGNNAADVYAPYGSYDSYLTFVDNHISDGQYGIYVLGYYSSPMFGLDIERNIIDSFGYYGIMCEYDDSVTIRHNFVNNPGNGYYGVYIYGYGSSNQYEISYNKIFAGSYAGLFAYYLGNGTYPARVFNNFIGASGSEGMQSYYSADVDIYFNNFLCYGSNSGSYSLYLYNYTTSSINVENNNLVNYAGGYGYYLSSTKVVSTENYNNFYTTGTNLASLGGAGYTSLSSWQSATSFDANSLNIDPMYVSNNNLHIKNGKLWKAGTPISYISYDIDSNVRNTTAPTIGAVEFFPPANDLAISAILTPLYGECGDSNTVVTVVLSNNGSKSQANVPVYTVISGATSTTLSATVTSIASGASDTIKYTTYLNSYNGGVFKLTAYASDTFKFNDSLTETIFINEQSPSPTVKGNSSCSKGHVELHATPTTAGDSIYWYSSKSGKAITSGDSFNTPSINTTTTYYAQESSRHDTFFWGPSSINAVSTSAQTGTSSAGIVFNVTTPITIDSITVYPSSSGNVGVTLYDSSGRALKTIYSSVTVLYSYSSVNIPVGITVGPGHNFSLALDSSNTGGFYYNNGGASYPYTIKNVASITNTTTNQGGSGYYYGLYNLQIHTGSCPSAFIPVTATIGKPSIKLSKNSTSGKFNAGTSSNPDAICAGSTFIYDLSTNFNNSGFGTVWSIPAYSLKTASGTAASVSLTNPTSTSDGELTFVSQNSQIDSTFILSVNVKDIAKGCDSVLTRYITVSGLPKIAVSPVSACLGTSETYSDSTNTTGSTFKWSFGDGSSNATGANPSHTYTTAGNYTLSLNVKNAAGCSDSGSTVITVNKLPTAAFGASLVSCPGQSIYFTDSSTAPGSATITGWEYNFGDGSAVSNSQSPSHQYATAGTDTVTLTVTSSTGCVATTTRTVVVPEGPKAGFTTNVVCSGDTTYFNNTSKVYTYAGTPTYLWNFGDNTGTSTTENPSHVYSSGTYRALLTITTASGCTDTFGSPIYIDSRPTAGISAPDSTCVNSTINIDDASTTSSSVTYNWNFGDGGTSQVANNKHTYTSAGKYVVKYKIQAGGTGGCPDSITKTITVFGLPTANFGADTAVCEDSKLQFTDSSKGAVSYSWNFGDGVGTSSTTNPKYTYTTSGNYTVTETVTNGAGCSSKKSMNVNVNPLPVDTFMYTENTTGIVTFTQSDATDKSVWNFGDKSSTSTTINPVHTYPSVVGKTSYFASLTTTSKNGCVYNYSDSVHVTVATGINSILAQSMNLQIAPNPFNSELRIDYTLTEAQNMKLSIYDVTGKEVTVIANSHQDPGKYTIMIDAAKYNMQAGVYFLHIVAGDQAIDEKIIRIN